MSTNMKSEIYTRDNQGIPSLIGSYCVECGQLSFPSKEVCPYCMTKGKSEKRLIGRTGKVVSVTTCHTAPKGIHAPYSLGIVEIEDGVHVLAQISGNEVRRNDEVELVIYSVVSEENNEEVLYWKYQVIQGGYL